MKTQQQSQFQDIADAVAESDASDLVRPRLSSNDRIEFPVIFHLAAWMIVITLIAVWWKFLIIGSSATFIIRPIM